VDCSRVSSVIMFSLAAWFAAALGAFSSGAFAAPDGASIYHDFCSVCHGDRGDGQSRARHGLVPPPRDFTIPGLSESLARSRMLEAVRNGIAGTAMVGWKTRLSDTESAAVVDYIRTRFMRAKSPPAARPPTLPTEKHVATRAPSAAANPSDAPFPNGLKGDAAAGRLFYNDNCATCHGKRGDGNGPRAYFIFPKPRNFLDPPVRQALNRPALFRATKNGVIGREMPAWGKVLNDQQIADVAEYVYRSFLRSPANVPR